MGGLKGRGQWTDQNSYTFPLVCVDVPSIVSDYLKQPQVVKKNIAEWTVESFALSIKVFVDMTQEAVATSTTSSGVTDTGLPCSSLRSRLDLLRERFKQSKQEAYKERVRRR